MSFVLLKLNIFMTLVKKNVNTTKHLTMHVIVCTDDMFHRMKDIG